MRKKIGQIGDFWISANRHGTWCRTWFDKETRQTRRVSLGTSDADEAILALARWVVLNEPLNKESCDDVPVAAVLERYYEHHGKELESADAAMRAVAMMKAFFQDDMVADLTLERQYQFEKSLRDEGKADGYIGRIQTTLKAAVNRAYRNQEIAAAPFVRVIGSDSQRERILTLDESARLFNAEPPAHVMMLMMILFNTLSRPGAALQLRPDQFDIENRLVALNPRGRRQTKKYRPTVPVTDTLLPWLQVHARQRFFVQLDPGQVAPLKGVRTSWEKLRARAGLGDDVVPYTIRHTMASELRRRGVPEWEVKGFLGHRGRGETERYAKFAPDYLGAAASAIDDYFHELQPLVERELIMNVRPLPFARKYPGDGA